MEAKLVRIKELITTKEAVGAELESLIAGEPLKARKAKTCSNCGSDLHAVRTCTEPKQESLTV